SISLGSASRAKGWPPPRTRTDPHTGRYSRRKRCCSRKQPIVLIGAMWMIEGSNSFATAWCSASPISRRTSAGGMASTLKLLPVAGKGRGPLVRRVRAVSRCLIGLGGDDAALRFAAAEDARAFFFLRVEGDATDRR